MPDDERVELVTVEPETMAVLRFSGDRGPGSVASRTAQLRETLRATGFEPIGDATAWFYDPPWTLSFPAPQRDRDTCRDSQAAVGGAESR